MTNLNHEFMHKKKLKQTWHRGVESAQEYNQGNMNDKSIQTIAQE